MCKSIRASGIIRAKGGRNAAPWPRSLAHFLPPSSSQMLRNLPPPASTLFSCSLFLFVLSFSPNLSTCLPSLSPLRWCKHVVEWIWTANQWTPESAQDWTMIRLFSLNWSNIFLGIFPTNKKMINHKKNNQLLKEKKEVKSGMKIN